jgi:glutathione synthase/RimK-type ligase-like ATP-grasp enzyme
MNGVSSPLANSPRLGLLGNPENRRILDFQAAVREQGGSSPSCLAYEELLNDPQSLLRLDVDLLRIDSPGENGDVARALITRGGGPENVCLAYGEIAYLREYHRGFCGLLDLVGESGIRCVNDPRDIAVMFDKWACHQRFASHGVPRPCSELAPKDFETLQGEMTARRQGRLFLKPLHGSSASGVCALRWTRQKQQLIAPIRVQSIGGRIVLVNSLKVCSYTTFADIESILRRLLPQGMICEQWIPKLTLPGGSIDLRVLVIGGEARHWVVRQSRTPMTNLHLGNQRGDKAALVEAIGASKLQAAFDLAEQAAACFPNSLYAGVDILIDSKHRSLVGEINAFGDLLPRLTHRGESAYEALAKACRAPSHLI